MTNSDCVDAILLDIEGTTTPVDYVLGILFPFARVHVESFLQAHAQDIPVQADLKRLWQEYEADIAQDLSVPEWKKDNQTSGAVPYIDYLISIDRKSTGLKSLQGKIWEQGYRDGTLRSQIFTDVKSAFERWTSALKKLFIFSSGSVQAQQLLFRYTEVGDLTGFLSGYFDTEMGPKKEADSYHKIAQTIKIPPARILFISDVAAELRAAQSAGMRVLFCLRPGNLSSDSEGFSVIQNFNSV
ncbi:MAG: acireductone synthase [Chroococcidiopsidaceae cyanobacterium CP_BM_ER_R8_30]|nr:acireductone synthase [Chroococcidiopsidaceae cyanobacterium CP_BM_ER_R8_30]